LDFTKVLKQDDEMFSEGSSILGDHFNVKDAEFKFEISSAVDSIEFPVDQNLNLK